MKRIFLYSAIILFLVFFPQYSCADVIDKIVAVVNNEIITQREVDTMLIPVYEQFRTIYSGTELIKRVEAARQEIMERIIEEKLILSEAKKANIDISEREIDDMMDQMKKRFATKKELDKALLEQNMTLKELRAKYKEQLMSRKFVFQKVGSFVTVTPVEIKEYYDSHPEEFTIPEQIRLRNILIKPRPNFPPERAAQAARDILVRLKAGEDFGEIARAVSSGPGASDGGLTGYAKRGDLMPDIEKAVFGKNAGEITDVIQTPEGFHIFKVEEKIDKRLVDLAEARRGIDEMLFGQKIRVKLKDWFAEAKKRAYIAFK